jgi:DNA-binding PadR family transcriptional regulator
MQQPTFLVLTALSSGPLHGYAILSEVDQLSGGQARLRVGTLYAALDRLAGEGLVELDSEEVVNGRLRRTYRLTGAGVDALSTEADRLRSLADQARKRLAARPQVAH